MTIKTRQIKYGYCVDINGELININDLSDETRHARKLFCLQCGQEMIANLGMTGTWFLSYLAYGRCMMEEGKCMKDDV